MPKKKIEETGEKEEKKEDKIDEKKFKEGDEPEKKKKDKGKEYEAVVNIYTSFNNTLVHVTDMSGKTLAKVTGGMVTKHGRLKANPTIAMFIAKRI
ncbi:MAG: 30S ribosomal protein S11, partial [Candidatus Pacearchaeota archaeon]